MTRRLFLLRHAQAVPQRDGMDKDRPLSAQGVSDAAALGRVMAERFYHPDLILCSPARRTQETLQAVSETIGTVKTLFPDMLYGASAAQLYEQVKAQENSVTAILLIAHNPSIHALARFLAGAGEEQDLQSLEMQYKECTLSVLDCPVEDWTALQPGGNGLEALLIKDRDF